MSYCGAELHSASLDVALLNDQCKEAVYKTAPLCLTVQMNFIGFDPDVEVSRTRRRLPHWFQIGRTYCVTFRLADSLPRLTRDAIKIERAEWLAARGVAKMEELSDEDRVRFRHRFTKKVDALLDNGYGECQLRDSANAAIVGDALTFFDGDRYELDAFVVMPNHVHLLVCPIKPLALPKILQSCKRHAAREINRRMGRTGQALWLDENFDHLVRSSKQLDCLRIYIEQNPGKAGLKNGEYLLGQGGAVL